MACSAGAVLLHTSYMDFACGAGHWVLDKLRGTPPAPPRRMW